MIPVPVDFPVLQSEAAIVLNLDEQGREISDGKVEETGPRVLYEKNVDKELPVASLTKMMTVWVVLEKVADGEVALGDKVTVTGEMLKGLEEFAVA
ncbi:serine hydrolase, partial [Candidatus Saccharibacteria bacterium]|nr:serine hydrolase [Candidatus Saccharibacteria bacterium]